MTIETVQEQQYKETKLGWLPKEWSVLPFEECLSDERVKTSKIQSNQYKKEGKYPIVDQCKELISGYWDNEKDLNFSILPVIIFGDHTRIFKYIGFPFVLGPDGTKVLKPNEVIVHPKFFYYFLKSLNIPSRGYNRHYSLLKEYLVAVPPLLEQQQIAGFLSSIQSAKEKSELVLQSLRELKKSLMRHLFTYGAVSLEDAAKVKLKETEIGQIPENWDLKRICDLFETSKKPRALTIHDDQKIVFIPMQGISESIQEASFELKPYSKIASGVFVQKGDLIIAKITPCFENGKQAVLDNLPDSFGIATTEVIPIHPKEKTSISSVYLYYYIKMSNVRNELASKMEGTTGRQRLPKKVVDDFLIPLPPLEEQKQMISMLSNIDYKIRAEENQRNTLHGLFKSMLSNLMSAKIRVNNLEF